MIAMIVDLMLEILFEVFFELLLELGFESVAEALGRHRKVDGVPALAYFGWFLIGTICGAGSALILPDRIVPRSGTPGVSLALSPLICGMVMAAIGDRRRRNGRHTTALATFWGGSLFAFGLALARLSLM